MSPDEHTQLMLIRLVDQLTALHLRLLAYLRDPEGWFISRGISKPNIFMGSRASVLESALPDLANDKAVYRQAVRELDAVGPVQDSLGGTGTEQGLYTALTTKFGNRFLAYISPSSVGAQPGADTQTERGSRIVAACYKGFPVERLTRPEASLNELGSFVHRLSAPSRPAKSDRRRLTVALRALTVMLRTVSRWLGVDVGGKRKGFDVAVVDDRQVVDIQGSLDHEAVAGLVAIHRPVLVAIDSPRCCAPEGQTTRSGERQVNSSISGIRWTPDERR